MASIEIFKNESFGEVRVAGTSEQPLFCLADVCRVLELQTGATKNRLDEKGISLINTPTNFVFQTHEIDTNCYIELSATEAKDLSDFIIKRLSEENPQECTPLF